MGEQVFSEQVFDDKHFSTFQNSLDHFRKFGFAS
jgi:hypothetical protein